MKVKSNENIIRLMYNEGNKFERILSNLIACACDEDVSKIKKTWPGIWNKFERNIKRKEPIN